MKTQRKIFEVNKIYNMDCLKGLKQLPDESIDLIITDPPYNTGMTNKERKNDKWLNSFFNDKFTDIEYLNLIEGMFKESFRVLKNNSACYIFINWKQEPFLRKIGSKYFKFKQLLIWDKLIHGLNYQNYAYRYECLLFFVKGDFRPKRIYNKTDILRYSRVNQNNEIDHETVKPVRLIQNIIKDNSDKGQIVLDMFMGSGTTAVACLMAQRNFIGFEISKKYCDIAEKRRKKWINQERIPSWFCVKNGR